MASHVRIVHYLNQFFSGIGGEEAGDIPVQVHEGPAGPGRLLQHMLGDEGKIIATIIGGDNYFAEQPEHAIAAVRSALVRLHPDVVVAGPAFDAGRYGFACAQVCICAQEQAIPAVTAMFPENPGFTAFRRHLICVPAGRSAGDMAPALQRIAGLVRKLGRGEPLGPAEVEGYLPRGLRRPVVRAKSGAARAVDMVLARIHKEPFVTEIPVSTYDRVPPASAVRDLSQTRVAVITSGGLVPKGNPDRLPSAFAEGFCRYSIADLSRLEVGDWESVHGGYSPHAVNTCNPNFVVPLDALRDLEARRTFGSLYPYYFVTVGNGTAVSEAQRMGAEIAEELLTARVGAALLVAT
jgi:glycine reductase